MTVESILKETGVWSHYTRFPWKTKAIKEFKRTVYAADASDIKEETALPRKIPIKKTKRLMENKICEMILSNKIEIPHWENIHPIQCYQKLKNYFTQN